MLVTCESCWICCAPCAMSCDHDDKTERLRHPDASWTCNRLLEAIGSRDVIEHALAKLEKMILADVPDGGPCPPAWYHLRRMREEL